MQIEVYEMKTENEQLTITLEAVCDSFSSLLWDVRYYECGQFEIYIAANARNLAIFQTGKIVGRDDDKQHFGIIEAVSLETNAEDGDYLTVTGRFLMSLLSRRIIYPTLYFQNQTAFGTILQTAIRQNCMQSGRRKIPGLTLGDVSGTCWEQTARLQVSYDNLMERIYKICEITGGTANIRLVETSASSGLYTMKFELSEGVDRSILQDENAHLVFSDSYNNLLSFNYSIDTSEQSNIAYVFGSGEGAERKRTLYFSGDEPEQLNRYEVYVDAKDISQETQNDAGETVPISDADYIELLAEKGAENLVPVTETSESTIAVDSKQYQYNKDYFVGDFVTVEHERFGLKQAKIQLVGMIESFDQNGRNLTPTFKI
jgi:hypothetical protein